MACKKFIGVLKYNSVFVTDESLNRLQEQGFGAKLFKPLPKHHIPSQDADKSASTTTPTQNPDDSNIIDNVDAPVVAIDNTAALGSATATDSDHVDDSVAMITDEDDKEVDKSVTIFEGSQVEEVIDEKATCLSLMLLDEEAFFLYTHDYLQLVTLNGSPVTSSLQLWHKFCEKNSKFPIKYKVYTFFRDRGYVVKTAVHFGFDYAVYRTIPVMSHSEICALVVDATKPLDITSSYKETEASSCQQGWRHISTLTRVMPDVMKLMTICYVLPVGDVDDSTATLYADRVEASAAASSTPGKEEAPVGRKVSEKVLSLPPLNMDKLFSGLTGPDSCEFIDYTTPKCLDELVVRPVTTLVRRLIAKSDGYQSIQGVQAKYRSMSILKKARQERVSKKKRRKRRDVVEIRSKITSKHNRMWQALAKPSAGAEGEEKKNKKNKNNEKKQENRQKQEDRVEKKKKEGEGAAGELADNYYTIFSVNNSPYNSDTEKRKSGGVKDVASAAVEVSTAVGAAVTSSTTHVEAAQAEDTVDSTNRSRNNSPVTLKGVESSSATERMDLEELVDAAVVSSAVDAMDVESAVVSSTKTKAVKSATKSVTKNTSSSKKRKLSSEVVASSPAPSELDGEHERLVAATSEGVATPLRRSTRMKK